MSDERDDEPEDEPEALDVIPEERSAMPDDRNVIPFRKPEHDSKKSKRANSRGPRIPQNSAALGGSFMKPGQNVMCKIIQGRSGGYDVYCVRQGIQGYLPSSGRYNVGDEVLATFVCIDRGRALLSERFNRHNANVSVSWEKMLDELDELDERYKTSEPEQPEEDDDV